MFDPGGPMIIEITQTTLKRLDNYRAVVEQDRTEADRRQWRVMTHEVMQAAQKAAARADRIGAAFAYAVYLHRLQTGQGYRRDIYGEPLLSQALAALLNELSIEPRLVPVTAVDAASGSQSA
jgi:hypothetical protein